LVGILEQFRIEVVQELAIIFTRTEALFLEASPKNLQSGRLSESASVRSRLNELTFQANEGRVDHVLLLVGEVCADIVELHLDAQVVAKVHWESVQAATVECLDTRRPILAAIRLVREKPPIVADAHSCERVTFYWFHCLERVSCRRCHIDRFHHF